VHIDSLHPQTASHAVHARAVDAGQLGRRRRRRRWRMGVLVPLLAALSCLNDALVPHERPGVRLDLRAQVEAGTTDGARAVTIDVFYRRADESLAPLPSTPRQVAVAAGGATEQPVVVQLNDCLADTTRIGAEDGGCHLVVTLSLVDQAGQQLASATQDIESPVSPGQTVSAAPVTLQAIEIVSISVPPILFSGDTLTMAAAAFVQDQIVSGRTFTWSSDNPLVATVDANGLLTAVAPGTATITATTGGVSGTVPVTVTSPPSNIVKVSGDGATCDLLVFGDCIFAVKVTDDAAQPVANATVTWTNQSSGSSFPAFTDSTGISTAHNQDVTITPGTYTQTATLDRTGAQVTFTYQLANFYQLIVLSDSASTGAGSVTVSTETTPNAFFCSTGAGGATSGTCQGMFPAGTHVTLTAAPADPNQPTLVFVGWGGACSAFENNPTCSLTLTAGQTVTAYFDIPL
jgi:hypothetical protein